MDSRLQRQPPSPSMKTRRIYVSYPTPIDPEMDQRIEQAIGIEADGKGSGFGSRDVEFTIDAGALPEALARLRQLIKKYPEIEYVRA